MLKRNDTEPIKFSLTNKRNWIDIFLQTITVISN